MCDIGGTSDVGGLLGDLINNGVMQHEGEGFIYAQYGLYIPNMTYIPPICHVSPQMDYIYSAK